MGEAGLARARASRRPPGLELMLCEVELETDADRLRRAEMLARRSFQLPHPSLQRLEPGPGALENPCLGIEFVAGDKVELAEARTQNRAEVALQVALGGAECRGEVVHEAPGNLVNAECIHRDPQTLAPMWGMSLKQCSKKGRK